MGLIITIVIIATIFSAILFGESEKDQYLNAPIADCPNMTLKEGIELISSVYNNYNVYFNYELRKAKNGAGEDAMFLIMYNMEGIYDTGVSIPIDLVDEEVKIGNFVYSLSGTALENSNNIKALLCNQ